MNGCLTEIRRHVDYAVSTAAALRYLTHEGCDGLLTLAQNHHSPDVRVEGAYSSAYLGRAAGIDVLARFCLDVNYSEKACHYLGELNRADAVPRQALAPDFRAMAELSQWLADPRELGRPPDRLRILDHRDLQWPPTRDRTSLWLIEYSVTDRSGSSTELIGVGFVGSITFSLSTYRMEGRPLEDIYAIHCYWELEAQGLLAEAEVEEGSTEYDGMFRQAPRDDVREPRIVRVVEFAPALYPQR